MWKLATGAGVEVGYGTVPVQVWKLAKRLSLCRCGSWLKDCLSVDVDVG